MFYCMKFPILLVFVSGLHTVLVSSDDNYGCGNSEGFKRHPTDCSKWFKCINGSAVPMPDCRWGKLFSKDTHTCVRKNSIWDDCPTASYKPQGVCSRGRNTISPKPDNCAQFYNCSLPIFTPRPGYLGDYVDECPYPNLFSQDTFQCEDFERVRCGQRKEIVYACDYEKLQCAVGSNCRPCQYDYPDCRQLPDGLYAWMENSPIYKSCYRGRGLLRNCPNFLVFSSYNGRCDYRNNDWRYSGVK